MVGGLGYDSGLGFWRLLRSKCVFQEKRLQKLFGGGRRRGEREKGGGLKEADDSRALWKIVVCASDKEVRSRERKS